MKKVLIVLPVYNEQKCLAKNVLKILDFCNKKLSDYNLKIVIANNASKDRTLFLAKELSKKNKNVDYVHLDKKGRGRALKFAWSKFEADVYCYMDIDLSTNLKSLPVLINQIEKGNDIAVGSRFLKISNVKRSIKREILSRGYNCLLKIFFNTKFKDSQCGFKAVNQNVVNEIIPLVNDNEWFFDTELLILAQKKEYSIKEIPVKWVEDKDSSVAVTHTVYSYLKSIMRLKKYEKEIF